MSGIVVDVITIVEAALKDVWDEEVSMWLDVDSASVLKPYKVLRVGECDGMNVNLLSILNVIEVTSTPGGGETLSVTGTQSNGASGKGGVLIIYFNVDGCNLGERDGRETLLHLLGG